MYQTLLALQAALFVAIGLVAVVATPADACPADPFASCRMWVRAAVFEGIEFTCIGSCPDEPPYCSMLWSEITMVKTCQCSTGRETRCDAQLRYEDGCWFHYCETPDPCPGIPSCRDGDYNHAHDPPWPFHWVAVCCCL
jgi:hypothetical protein